jgi:hypothetical protein
MSDGKMSAKTARRVIPQLFAKMTWTQLEMVQEAMASCAIENNDRCSDSMGRYLKGESLTDDETVELAQMLKAVCDE